MLRNFLFAMHHRPMLLIRFRSVDSLRPAAIKTFLAGCLVALIAQTTGSALVTGTLRPNLLRRLPAKFFPTFAVRPTTAAKPATVHQSLATKILFGAILPLLALARLADSSLIRFAASVFLLSPSEPRSVKRKNLHGIATAAANAPACATWAIATMFFQRPPPMLIRSGTI